MAGLSIGVVAARAGVKVDTVRYYERRGLLPAAERRRSGYRSFEPQAVERIRLVKQLQALGMRLDEVAGLLRLIDDGGSACDAARPRVAASLQRIDEQIAALSAMRARLTDLVQRCGGGTCALVAVAPTVRQPRRHTR